MREAPTDVVAPANDVSAAATSWGRRRTEDGGDAQLAESALALVVIRADETRDPHPVAGQLPQRVTVESTKVGRDDGHARHPGSTDGQQLRKVRATAHELDVKGRLQEPHELRLVAVGEGGQHPGHEVAAGETARHGHQGDARAQVDVRDEGRHILPRHHDVDRPGLGGRPSTLSSPATLTTDTALENPLRPGIRRQAHRRAPALGRLT